MASAGDSPLTELFGPQLFGDGDAVVDSSSLSSNELIGIYFSAHWCPPCKQFTPRLVECYNKINENGKRFEVVFVSSDQDKGQYDEYFGEMPWLSVGFQSPIDATLSKKYRVQGIPTLVFINPQTGKTVTKDGRSIVMGDLDGTEFPWTPKSFWETMGDAEIAGKSDDEKTTAAQLKEQLAGGFLGIYFSAHWCPPCRGFTPKLVEWYNEKKDTLGAPFEIIFASSDNSDAEFNGYYAEMPWKTIPYANRGLKEKLSSMFGVRGIPTFAIVDVNTGKTVTTTARMGVMGDPDGFPWAPKAFGVLSQVFLSEIESTPFLLLFSEDDGQGQVALLESEGQAVMAKDAESGEGFDLILCTVPKTMDLRGRLRTIMKLEETDTKLLILNLSEGCFYPCADDKAKDANQIDQAVVDGMVAAFRSGNANKVALTPPGQ